MHCITVSFVCFSIQCKNFRFFFSFYVAYRTVYVHPIKLTVSTNIFYVSNQVEDEDDLESGDAADEDDLDDDDGREDDM